MTTEQTQLGWKWKCYFSHPPAFGMYMLSFLVLNFKRQERAGKCTMPQVIFNKKSGLHEAQFESEKAVQMS